MPRDYKGEVNLPNRPFLYTLDQIATMLDITERSLRVTHVYFEGRSIGVKPKHQMSARNIAPPDQRPDWRVVEEEFIRWCRHKGFRLITRSYFRS